MKTIILINGPKRSGKNYVSELIKSLEEDTQEFSIAEPAKRIIAKTMGISVEDLNEYKDDDDYGLEIKVYPNNQPSATINYLNFRSILQIFAVDSMMEEFGKTIWVEKCAADIDKSKKVFNIVADFRFPFEEKVFRELADTKGYEVVTIKIFNDDLKLNDSHISENALKDFKFNYTINNTGKPDLNNTVKSIIKSIKAKSLDLY